MSLFRDFLTKLCIYGDYTYFLIMMGALLSVIVWALTEIGFEYKFYNGEAIFFECLGL